MRGYWRHARLLAVAVELNGNFDEKQKAEVLVRWESVTFRILECIVKAREQR